VRLLKLRILHNSRPRVTSLWYRNGLNCWQRAKASSQDMFIAGIVCDKFRSKPIVESKLAPQSKFLRGLNWGVKVFRLSLHAGLTPLAFDVLPEDSLRRKTNTTKHAATWRRNWSSCKNSTRSKRRNTTKPKEIFWCVPWRLVLHSILVHMFFTAVYKAANIFIVSSVTRSASSQQLPPCRSTPPASRLLAKKALCSLLVRSQCVAAVANNGTFSSPHTEPLEDRQPGTAEAEGAGQGNAAARTGDDADQERGQNGAQRYRSSEEEAEIGKHLHAVGGRGARLGDIDTTLIVSCARTGVILSHWSDLSLNLGGGVRSQTKTFLKWPKKIKSFRSECLKMYVKNTVTASLGTTVRKMTEKTLRRLSGASDNFSRLFRPRDAQAAKF